MVTTHNLGFPRIGKKRELKFALEQYWKKETTQQTLQQTATELRLQHWHEQASMNYVPVGDFSFYDQVLDTSFLLGNIPDRVCKIEGNELDSYFRVARGRSGGDTDNQCVHAGEMTKWFDTNYHYIVPEFEKTTQFSLHAENLLHQITEAKQQGCNVKPVIIGPVTYLSLGKSKDGSDKLALLDQLLPVYIELIEKLKQQGLDWVQIDEPILVTELAKPWQQAFTKAYSQLASTSINILLATYFGQLKENLALACKLPVNGLHLDVTYAQDELEQVISDLPNDRVLSIGVINGRNIWKTNLSETLDWLEPIQQLLKDRLWLAPSCSLLHVPVDLNSEQKLNIEIQSWLAFAVQKLAELKILANALNYGRDSVAQELADNLADINNRKLSKQINNKLVKQRVSQIEATMSERQSNYAQRADIQANKINLPLFPTTTIGSFPQTTKIRKVRKDYRLGDIDRNQYQLVMQEEITNCVGEQELLGLDVLVHGEAERNDMVEYFAEKLAGFIFTQFGWVQSYGSRCVKPPVIVGDISRPTPMTVDTIKFAKSLTDKPMKGMLTGPVTILNWSFVRDDQSRSETCLQLALAIRDEVLDLEQAGIQIIQIDEAALREGLPLRKSQWKTYLDWATFAFRITANGVKDETQIHTHMCYSEFNDIIAEIAAMDADVITIETSRSDMELLDVFDQFQYPNAIGPGVYDIHSPNIPSVESMVQLIQKAAQRIPLQRLWVNPDCGLKTRSWDEVKPALKNMVAASKQLRKIVNQ